MTLALLAPMSHELAPLVTIMGLTPVPDAGDDRHAGTLDGTEVVAVTTGIGMAAAAAATTRLLDSLAVAHVIVVGIAGGVAPDAEIGDVVIPASVIDGPTGRHHVPAPIAGPAPFGALHTSDDLAVDADAFTRFAAEGVVALDMETSAVAAVCESRGCPWSVVRSISDRPRDGLVDDAVFALTKPDGSADPEALRRYLAEDPTAADRLTRLAHDMEVATTAAATVAIEACRAWPVSTTE